MQLRTYYATFGAKRAIRNTLGILCTITPGATYHEDKGWFVSKFYLRAPRETHEKLLSWMNKAMSE